MRRRSREQHRHDAVLARQGHDLPKVLPKVARADPLGKISAPRGQHGQPSLEDQLGQAELAQSPARPSGETVDLLVLDAEPDPVIVPSVVHGDHSRAQGDDVPLHLLKTLKGGPAAHRQLEPSDLPLGMVGAQPFDEEPRIVAELGARIAHEDDVDAPRSMAAKSRVIVLWNPE